MSEAFPYWSFSKSKEEVLQLLRDAGVIARLERTYHVRLTSSEIVIGDQNEFFQAKFTRVGGGAGGRDIIFRYGITDPLEWESHGIFWEILEGSPLFGYREIHPDEETDDFLVDRIDDLDLGYHPRSDEPVAAPQPHQPQQPQQPGGGNTSPWYVVNPSSGRKVLANGRIGKKILQSGLTPIVSRNPQTGRFSRLK